jgi:iron complex transport system ATP-binding protein
MNPPHDVSLLRIHNATVMKGPGRGRAVLDRLSLDIPQGQHTAILGPNGSGKSSLIKLLTQEYRPLAHPGQAPAIELFGRARWDIFQLRSLMGIVSPDIHSDLAAGAEGRPLSGLEVVVSGFFSTRGVQPYQQVSEEMWDGGYRALDLMEAVHLADKPMPEMSTGEARRVLIARALAPDPPALLLDEPTTGLDLVAAARFLETLRRLAQRGKTIIFVTHHLHEIIPEVQRVVLLRDGKIYLDGPKLDVLTGESLSAAFGAEVQVHHDVSGFYSMAVPTSTEMGSPTGLMLDFKQR